jgi:hypothetical protein
MAVEAAIAVQQPNSSSLAMGTTDIPLPQAYGIYAISNGELFELDPLPGRRIPDDSLVMSQRSYCSHFHLHCGLCFGPGPVAGFVPAQELLSLRLYGVQSPTPAAVNGMFCPSQTCWLARTIARRGDRTHFISGNFQTKLQLVGSGLFSRVSVKFKRQL